MRKDGKIVEVPLAYKEKVIDFGVGKYNTMTIPWGDVFTAYHSTGIPNIDIDSGDSPLVIPAKDLKELIRNTSFAMGNQDWRHYLNGLYLSISGGEGERQRRGGGR